MFFIETHSRTHIQKLDHIYSTAAVFFPGFAFFLGEVRNNMK